MNKKSGYYIDTHMHTSETSACGNISAAEGVVNHKKAGFDTVIITDHFNEWTLGRLGESLDEQIGNWLSGYENAKAAGQKVGLEVLLGAEFGISGSNNEYLLYGIKKEYLHELADLFLAQLIDLYEYTRKKDILIVQAHPFRKGNSPMPAELLDGAEVFNGNPRHNNENALAKKFCLEHGLLMTAGGDYHETEDLSYAMKSDEAVCTINDFTTALKNGAMQACKYKGISSFIPVE